MSGGVVDLNEVKANKEQEIPEATRTAMFDPGWFAASRYIVEIGQQILGDNAMVVAIPDPEGFHQKQAGKTGDRSGLFVEVHSANLPGLSAGLVVPFDIESLQQLRQVFTEVAMKLYAAEQQAAASNKKLLVPEHAGQLIVPGKE